MNAKQKGNRGEWELLSILQPMGIPCRRNDQRYIGGKNNPDISAELNGIPLHIEVKRRETLNIHAAIAQAVKDSDGKAVPVVVHRRNREKWLVTMQLSDILSHFQNDKCPIAQDDF